MNSLKKIASILLLLALWISSIGYFHIFRLIQADIRHEIKKRMEQNIPDGELTRITFTSSENPEWVRKDKEFRYGGRMYDIVRTRNENGLTVYYCIDDVEESRLVSKMDKSLEEGSDDASTPLARMSRALLSFYSGLFLCESRSIFQPISTSVDLIGCYLKNTLPGFPPALVIPPVPVA